MEPQFSASPLFPQRKSQDRLGSPSKYGSIGWWFQWNFYGISMVISITNQLNYYVAQCCSSMLKCREYMGLSVHSIREAAVIFRRAQDGAKTVWSPSGWSPLSFLAGHAHQCLQVTFKTHDLSQRLQHRKQGELRIVFDLFGVWTIHSSVLPADLPSAMERETENVCPSHPKSARLGKTFKPLEPGKNTNFGPCWKHAMAKVGISPCPVFETT